MNEYLAAPAKYLNSNCNKIISTRSHFSGLFQSFLCGKKLEKNLPKEILIKSGVYHLIVVSGGHFLFLEQIFNFLKFPFFVRSVLLFLYYLTTGLQAPGLRALVHLFWDRLLIKHAIPCSALNTTFISGLFCLILNSTYWFSLSFWLSFSVSMALTSTQSLFYQEKAINRFILHNLTIYVFLLPFLMTLSYSHPLTLFVGSLLTLPTFFFLVLSTLVLFLLEYGDLSSLIREYDQIITGYFKILDHLGTFSAIKNNEAWYWNWFWFYLFCLFICTHFFRLFLERRSTHV